MSYRDRLREIPEVPTQATAKTALSPFGSKGSAQGRQFPETRDPFGSNDSAQGRHFPESEPQPRATAHFRLRGDEGGGTLIGRPSDTYQDLVADLRGRYGERLVDVKPNHEEPDMTDGMTEDERQRMAVVEAGGTVVAHMPRRSARGDAVLIAWAQRTGRFVRIDRKTDWGNPFEIPKHGNRDQVCDAYAEHLAASPDLLARLPELRGKVLGCWCYPERCHGDEIIKRLAVLP